MFLVVWWPIYHIRSTIYRTGLGKVSRGGGGGGGSRRGDLHTWSMKKSEEDGAEGREARSIEFRLSHGGIFPLLGPATDHFFGHLNNVVLS